MLGTIRPRVVSFLGAVFAYFVQMLASIKRQVLTPHTSFENELIDEAIYYVWVVYVGSDIYFVMKMWVVKVLLLVLKWRSMQML
uniref:Bestrophin homolog n=1 Tax=Steinernema glaseri TaxID=37863 RepID=A0A1I7Z5G8_9BILA